MEKFKLDFYEILSLPRNSSIQDIKKAYRKKLVNIKHELETDKDDKNTKLVLYEFKQLNEAFSTLKHPLKRVLFDNMSPNNYFKGFFKGIRVPIQFRDQETSRELKKDIEKFKNRFSFKNENLPLNVIDINSEYNKTFKFKDIVLNQEITLKDIYILKTIPLKFKRLIFDDYNKFQKKLEYSVELKCTSSLLFDQKKVFKGQGNIYPFDKKTDLIVNFKIKKELNFKNKGFDLFQTIKIALLDSLTLNALNFQDLLGEKDIITLNKVISPYSVLKIPGKGFYREILTKSRGDLYLIFDIIFPKFIEQNHKQLLDGILSN